MNELFEAENGVWKMTNMILLRKGITQPEVETWTTHERNPGRLTWNLERMVCNRNLLFQGVIFRFHIKLWQGIKIGLPKRNVVFLAGYTTGSMGRLYIYIHENHKNQLILEMKSCQLEDVYIYLLIYHNNPTSHGCGKYRPGRSSHGIPVIRVTRRFRKKRQGSLEDVSTRGEDLIPLNPAKKVLQFIEKNCHLYPGRPNTSWGERCLKGFFWGFSHTSSPGVWKPRVREKNEICQVIQFVTFFHPLVGGHLTIPKRSQRIARYRGYI